MRSAERPSHPGGLAGPAITQMARKRFRSSQRHEAVTERSFQEYLYSTAAPQTSRTELMRLVRGGEDTFLELKVKLSNPERIAQEIVAMANTCGGRFFIRIGAEKREATPEELSALLDDSLPLLYENVPALRAMLADIDEAHLWSFMRGFEGGAFDAASVKDYPTGEILERYLMLATNSHDDVVPTVASLLLFGRDESVAALLPRAAMIATRFSGDNAQAPVIERIELHGSLATVYESALR